MPDINHSTPIIELDAVSFSYTHEEVIQNVSLHIHTGEYVGIIGPNGGGKSTLLKLMLGIIKPSRGTIKLFNQDIHNFKDWYKIGYVPQRNSVEMNFPVTVQELVAMGRYGKRGLFHFPNKEDSQKVIQALKQVDMLEYKNHQVNDLSGGQQQRIFIARALAVEPQIIFLDEPTVGVDIKTQNQFYTLLRKLNKELSLTLILVSHELQVVGQEATKIGYINRTLEYYGNPKEFLKGSYFQELTGRGKTYA